MVEEITVDAKDDDDDDETESVDVEGSVFEESDSFGSGFLGVVWFCGVSIGDLLSLASFSLTVVFI